MTTCRDIGDNLRAARHFLTEHDAPAPEIPANRFVLVGFDACNPAEFTHDPPLQPGRVYHFTPGADGNQFLGAGFSDPESWGRWTDARNAFAFFSLGTAPLAPVSVTIEANSLSFAADSEQTVDLVANDQTCGQLIVTATRQHAAVACPAGSLRAGDNTLRFHIAHPTRPIDIGLNTDRRLHGLGLIALTLLPKE